MGLEINHKYLKIIFYFLVFLLLYEPSTQAAPPDLGRALNDREQLSLQSILWPDGANLPAGDGSVADGEVLYRNKCIACHGPQGRGGAGGELAGAQAELTAEQPDQTIGTYWPYATTLFDFVRRAMPLNQPWSLSDSEVYAVVAYLLHLNGLLRPDDTLDATRLRALQMPNANGFDGIEASWP